MKKIFILGAGTAGMNPFQIIMDINSINNNKNYSIEGFIDNDPSLAGKKLFGKKIFIGLESIDKEFLSDCYIICGIPDPKSRVELFNLAIKLGFKVETIIHPSAQISPYAKIGKGVLICQNCLVQPYAEIEDYCYIHAGSVIGPKVKIGTATTVNSLVAISSSTKIGKRCYIGVGASIIQRITIGNEAVIGGNAVVINTIPDRVTAVGVPTKVVKKHNKKFSIRKGVVKYIE